LGTIYNELNTVSNKNSINHNFFKSNYQSIISNLFYGMYNLMMKCLNFNILTHNIQIYNNLIFDLEEVRKYKNNIQNIVDIIECFEYYQKEDIIMGENQINYNNCYNVANIINISKLIITPNILIIKLNRGKRLQFDVKLAFGQYLDIRNFIYYKDSSSYYELKRIFINLGPSSRGGHFIASCKNIVGLGINIMMI